MRSDIYSLGAVLYELLTFRRPVTGETLEGLLAAVIAGRVVPPRERAPERDIPARLEAVVMRAMATDPAERHQTVLELQADVRRAIVAGRVADEIDLRRIDPSVIYSAVIGLHRTHLWLSRAYLELAAPWELTPAQVNLVRIVHGSRETGVTFADLYERQIWTDFDTLGSVQGLVDAGLVRTEGEGDARRYVATRKGQEAAEAIIALDHRIEAWFGSSDLDDDEWRTLSDLLARIRAGDLRQYGTWAPDAPGSCPPAGGFHAAMKDRNPRDAPWALGSGAWSTPSRSAQPIQTAATCRGWCGYCAVSWKPAPRWGSCCRSTRIERGRSGRRRSPVQAAGMRCSWSRRRWTPGTCWARSP